MKRPKKYKITGGMTFVENDEVVIGVDMEWYLAREIDPLLDELERLKSVHGKPFPSLEEFTEWYNGAMLVTNKTIHAYFSQFCYERTVYPKVGDVVEGEDEHGLTVKGAISGFKLGVWHEFSNIRPVPTPTREDLLSLLTGANNAQLDNLVSIDKRTIEAVIKELETKG